MTKLILILVIALVTTCSLLGQVVTINGGPTYIIHKEQTKIHKEARGAGRLGNDDFFIQINYMHYIYKNWNLKIGYTKYPIATMFHFYKENAGGSVGWVGTDVKRLDIGLSYFLFNNAKIIVQPSVGFGIQRSIPKDIGIIGGDISEGIKPDHFELLKDIEAYAYKNNQIVPVVGLKLGYAFWSRLELFIEAHQVFGFKTIQELRMSYTYKGIEQPEAISYSDGTGRFWALGLGYRFVKPKK